MIFNFKDTKDAKTLEGKSASEFRLWHNGDITSFNAAVTRGKYRVNGKDLEGAPHTGNIFGTLYNEIADGKQYGDQNGAWLTQIFIETNRKIYTRQKINGNGFSPWDDWSDAETLGGHGAEYFAPQASLDAVQSNVQKNLTTEGWYRIAQNTNDYVATCLIKMGNMYNVGGCSENLLLYSQSYANSGFTALSCKSKNKQMFSKIRKVKEGNIAYFEVYYTHGGANPCSFAVLDFGYNKTNPWLAIEPVATQENVDGVTVIATYDIPANATVVTDLDLADYLPLIGGTLGNGSKSYPLIIRGSSSYSLIDYMNDANDTRWGSLGFAGVNNPCFLTGDRQNGYGLLHSGNSAKVVISSTAPSDTSALWVY